MFDYLVRDLRDLNDKYELKLTFDKNNRSGTLAKVLDGLRDKGMEYIPKRWLASRVEAAWRKHA